MGVESGDGAVTCCVTSDGRIIVSLYIILSADFILILVFKIGGYIQRKQNFSLV